MEQRSHRTRTKGRRRDARARGRRRQRARRWQRTPSPSCAARGRSGPPSAFGGTRAKVEDRWALSPRMAAAVAPHAVTLHARSHRRVNLAGRVLRPRSRFGRCVPERVVPRAAYRRPLRHSHAPSNPGCVSSTAASVRLSSPAFANARPTFSPTKHPPSPGRGVISVLYIALRARRCIHRGKCMSGNRGRRTRCHRMSLAKLPQRNPQPSSSFSQRSTALADEFAGRAVDCLPGG